MRPTTVSLQATARLNLQEVSPMEVRTLSAVLTGFPARLTQPRPLQGETIFQMVLRNHSRQWKNTVERLTSDYNLPQSTSDLLQRGRFRIEDLTDGRLQDAIEDFVNDRIPTHGRTMKSIAGLRRQMRDPMAQEMAGFTIVDVIVPREHNSHGDATDENEIKRMGGKVISYPPGSLRTMNLADILPHTTGQFIWFIPGGTQFGFSDVVQCLERIMRTLTSSSGVALYTDI